MSPARTPLVAALAVGLTLGAALGACSGTASDPSEHRGPEPDAASTCTQDVVNGANAAFRIEPVGEGGPHLDRNLLVDLYGKRGYFCADIAIDHADSGAEATAYSVTATQDDRTWHQEGTDPDDQGALRIDTMGCVDLVATLTVIGAGDEEFDYRASGRLGLGCRG